MLKNKYESKAKMLLLLNVEFICLFIAKLP